MNARRAGIVLITGFFAACSLAPTYQVPDVGTGATLESAEWHTARPMDELNRGPWWEAFSDSQLNSLEVKASDANQDLRAAFARLQQARADTRIARADLFPTVSAGAAATRARTSVNAPGIVPGGVPTNNYRLEADFSYEFDVWGRVRSVVAAATANEQASAADLAALKLSIQAELAAAYFSLRAADARQLLLDQTVAHYAESLRLTQNLYDGGAASVADVAQAQAQLETARTQAFDASLQRAQSEHAIAILIGDNPLSFRLCTMPMPADLKPPAISTGLPSALLERRPDVASAERRVAAANAQIGAARAAYFPIFSLSAAAGFDSRNASTWLNAPSRFWSIGPAGVLTVFDAGRHRAQAARAEAKYDEQVAAYRGTVLVAYKEVEDNLVALRLLELENVSASAAMSAAAKAALQAQYRYKAGLVSYLEVAANENLSLQAQLSYVTIQSRRMLASVLLVKGLGGGWQASDLSLPHPL